jgi:hypothetical protein
MRLRRSGLVGIGLSLNKIGLDCGLSIAQSPQRNGGMGLRQLRKVPGFTLVAARDRREHRPVFGHQWSPAEPFTFSSSR